MTALAIEEGAGKAGCPPHPRPPCVKKARGRNHRYGRSNPAFPAQWFDGLFRALPGDRAFLPPSPRENRFRATWHQRRVARTTRLCRTRTPSPRTRDRPGTVRHSFGESGSASLVLRHRRVHRIPHSTSVTIAKRPSDERGTAGANHAFPKNGR